MPSSTRPSPAHPATGEARREELGHQVVLVEDEAGTPQPEQDPDEEEEVRRVAAVHHVDAGRTATHERQPDRVEQRRRYSRR